MSDDATAWKAQPASDLEVWALAQNREGWICAEELKEWRNLSDEVSSLRRELERLEAKTAETVVEAERQARERVATENRALVIEVQRYKARVLDQAAQVALEIAAIVIEGEFSTSAERVDAWISRAVSRRAGRLPTTVRASAALCAMMSTDEHRPFKLVVDERLNTCDLILEYSDGKLELPLREALRVFLPDVREELLNDE